MTSPPQSETGPSAEEQAHAIAKVCWDEKLSMMEAEIRVAEMVAQICLSERRSAHLRDARAGCGVCRGAHGEFYALEPTRNEDGQWYHKPEPCAKSPEWLGLQCLRPEVWDALSLLPGGQK